MSISLNLRMVGLSLIKFYTVGPCTNLSHHFKFHNDQCNRSGMLHKSLIWIHRPYSWSTFLLKYSSNLAKLSFYCISSKVELVCPCTIPNLPKIETLISYIGSQNNVHYINHLNIAHQKVHTYTFIVYYVWFLTENSNYLTTDILVQ